MTPPESSSIRTMSLRESLVRIGLIWLAANLVVAGAALTFGDQSYRETQQKVRDLGSNLTQGIELSVGSRIDRTFLAEHSLAAALRLEIEKNGKINPSAATRMIEHFESQGVVEPGSLRVTNKVGLLVAGDGARDPVPANYSERSYFKELAVNPQAGKSFSGKIVGLVSKKPQIVIAIPYFDANGSFAGVVHCALSLKAIENLMKTAASNDDDTMVLRDTRDFGLLARFDPRPLSNESAKKAVNRTGGVANSSKKAMDSGQTFGHYIVPPADAADGVIHFATFKRLTSAPFFLIVSLGDSHFESWCELVSMLVAFSAGFALLSAGAAVGLARYEKASREAELELKSLNASLEQQVHQRTTDLQETLARLTQGQQELASAEKLASLGKMVAGVSHELNTPLGNALLCASSMAEDAATLEAQLSGASGVPLKRSALALAVDKLRRMADAQAISIEHATRLVLAFKQIAVDQTSERKRLLDLGETLDSVVASFMPTILRSHTKVSVSVEARRGLLCDTFPGALVQITSNMLQNALRHAFDGRPAGSITIRARTEHDAQGVEVACVEFIDDGHGLPKGSESLIFDDYFTTKASSGGSGLGLSLSRQLAQSALHGSLTSVNAPTGGAIFTLRFPTHPDFNPPQVGPTTLFT